MWIVAENQNNSKLNSCAYILCCSDDTLQPWDIKVVKRNNPCIQTALENAPEIPDLKEGGFWDSPDFCFYQNAIGIDYIRRNIQELKDRGWQVTIGRSKHNRQLIGTFVWKDSVIIRACFPKEFPINPPSLFDVAHNEIMGLNTLAQWNSDRSLFEVLDECIGMLECQ